MVTKVRNKIFLELINKGDIKAFSTFYEESWEDLFCYVISIVKSKDDAMDIVQESFIAMWEKKELLHTIQNIKPYLYSIAKFKTIRFIKLNIRERTFQENMLKIFDELEHSLEDNFLKIELEKLINREIDKLPTKMREIFILSRKEQLSYLEIANQLDISDKTVKKQINNAIKIIKLKLDKSLFFLIFLF